jgi:hypothetical protein
MDVVDIPPTSLTEIALLQRGAAAAVSMTMQQFVPSTLSVPYPMSVEDVCPHSIEGGHAGVKRKREEGG